jgi:hypothetical protein
MSDQRQSTTLGTIDLARDVFTPNEILSNGAFRPATAREISKYKMHQWLLDYGVDTLAYGWAGLTVAAAEHRQQMPWQNPTKQWQWHPISPQDQLK